MSRIIVYIGTGGTDSERLQQLFFRNRAVLRQNNVIVPMFGADTSHDMLVHAFDKTPHGSDKDTAHLWARLAKKYADSDKTVLISSCEFSRFGAHDIDMAKLRSLVDEFDTVTVICTLRNQASMFQDIYQEVSKVRHPGSWGTLLEQATHAYQIDGYLLEFNALYDRICEGFDPTEIEFLSYELETEHDGTIEAALLWHLGIGDLKLNYSGAVKDTPVDPLICFSANQLAVPKHPNEDVYRIVQKAFLATHKQKGPTTFFAIVEHQKFADVFDKQNRQFEKRIAKKQPMFEIPAMLEGKNVTYRGALKQDFWLNIAAQLVERRF